MRYNHLENAPHDVSWSYELVHMMPVEPQVGPVTRLGNLELSLMLRIDYLELVPIIRVDYL